MITVVCLVVLIIKRKSENIKNPCWDALSHKDSVSLFLVCTIANFFKGLKMENIKITPREFSIKSLNNEIIKKQLELKGREIALNEKQIELKANTKTISKGKVRAIMFATLLCIGGLYLVYVNLSYKYRDQIADMVHSDSIIDDIIK